MWQDILSKKFYYFSYRIFTWSKHYSKSNFTYQERWWISGNCMSAWWHLSLLHVLVQTEEFGWNGHDHYVFWERYSSNSWTIQWQQILYDSYWGETLDPADKGTRSEWFSCVLLCIEQHSVLAELHKWAITSAFTSLKSQSMQLRDISKAVYVLHSFPFFPLQHSLEEINIL